MIHRLLGSRALMSIIGTVVLALVVIVGFTVYSGPDARSLSYCALMPDSIGLHKDSKVTIRGIDVGAVTAIRGNGATVRVDFTVEEKHAPVGEVSATTVSDSIVADRDLTVFSDGAGQAWNPDTCITSTLTPQSLTTALDAVAHLSDELRGTEVGTESDLGESLRALDNALSGTGGEVNTMINTLGGALGSADVDIARIGRIIDALSSLAASANRGWTDIQAMFTRFPETFEVLDNQLFPMVVELGDALAKVLPMLNELSVLAGGSVSEDSNRRFHSCGGRRRTSTVCVVSWTWCQASRPGSGMSRTLSQGGSRSDTRHRKSRSAATRRALCAPQ